MVLCGWSIAQLAQSATIKLMLKFSRRRLLPALLLLVLTACDQSTLGQTGVALGGVSALASSLPDPCTLLTPAEVLRALGQPITDPTIEQELGDAECTYETPAAPGEPAVVVELTKVNEQNATFSQRVQFFRTEGAQPISGIGPEAYALGGRILTYKPGIILFVSVSDGRSDDRQLLQAARSLTGTVLNRLP